MGRKLTKPRPLQGAHLAELRKAAGLSQYQLAAIVDEPQANIALWERSANPPRADALPKLANALGVTVELLLHPPGAKSLAEKKGGPTGNLRRVFEQAARLPRYQQDKLAQVVAIFLNQYKLIKSSKSRHC